MIAFWGNQWKKAKQNRINMCKIDRLYASIVISAQYKTQLSFKRILLSTSPHRISWFATRSAWNKQFHSHAYLCRIDTVLVYLYIWTCGKKIQSLYPIYILHFWSIRKYFETSNEFGCVTLNISFQISVFSFFIQEKEVFTKLIRAPQRANINEVSSNVESIIFWANKN